MATTNAASTVRELIREHYSALTQAERKFANALLDNYPAAGLASITIVASNVGVSSPTVARMVKKLGFKEIHRPWRILFPIPSPSDLIYSKCSFYEGDTIEDRINSEILEIYWDHITLPK